MSADNGIYILVTKGPEYRVSHAQAIDNIHYNEDSDHDPEFFNSDIVYDYFGECQVFTNEDDALKEATRLEEDIGWTEYGICSLYFEEETFPGWIEAYA